MYETVLIKLSGEKVLGTFPTFASACASAMAQWTSRNVAVVREAATDQRWSYSEMCELTSA